MRAVADKTREVDVGIRVIVLGNFVESLASPEISALRQWLNVHRRDIEARQRSSRSTLSNRMFTYPRKGTRYQVFIENISSDVADDEQRHVR